MVLRVRPLQRRADEQRTFNRRRKIDDFANLTEFWNVECSEFDLWPLSPKL
jgi:hypothetical protein